MNTGIIVAAGQGTRMGGKVDKLFLPVAGHPVLAHAWRAFEASPEIQEMVLVVRGGQERQFHTLAVAEQFRKPFRVVAGGEQRQDSVWNGLQAVDPASEAVAIHDGARPCVTRELIRACLEAAVAYGAAVVAQRVTDTIKDSMDGFTISGHLDRARLWAVQTPQCFQRAVLLRALAAARAQGLQLTDDTAACALIEQPVRLVPAAQPNPKVTVPGDLPYIEMLLAGGSTGPR